MRALLAISLFLVLGACEVLGPPPRACTAIGCESAVTIVADEDLMTGAEYVVEVCVDGRCERESLTVAEGGGAVGASSGGITIGTDVDTITYAVGDGDWSGVHRVTATVRDAATGEVLVDVGQQVEFERSQPNGPGCEPICWFAEIRAA